MLPKILKNFNVFVDGRGYAGKIDEVTLPKLTIKTEEYRAGGMDIPINIDMGMEKLEAEFTFSEYDSELFRLFGLIAVVLKVNKKMKNAKNNFYLVGQRCFNAFLRNLSCNSELKFF